VVYGNLAVVGMRFRGVVNFSPSANHKSNHVPTIDHNPNTTCENVYNAALAEQHSPPGTDGCSDTKANGAVK